jgi:CHRD domain-containing protein
MSRVALRATALAAVIALLGVGSYAIAGGGSKQFRGDPLNGYEENIDVSTVATGSFSARLSDDGTALEYELSYSGLEGAVTQAHVHFGKYGINGGISFWLCGTAAAPGPTGTPACPAPGGTIEDEIVAADVVGPAGQGIEAGNLPEILAAMRAGHAYANVHSTKWPGGEIRAQIDDRRKHGRDD